MEKAVKALIVLFDVPGGIPKKTQFAFSTSTS